MQEQDGNYTIRVDNQDYTLTKPLEGRGQSAMAGFFKKNTSDTNAPQVLIKEDNPGTCLAESLVVDYFPTALEKPTKPYILKASLGETNIHNQSKSVSIQPQYSLSDSEKSDGLQIKPFDQIIFNKKRNPKTIISQEFFHAQKIKDTIKAMNSSVKDQLAAAIFTSQLNGDESLHTGQFMVKTDNSNTIFDIVRIDFGSLGRYAQARQDFDPFNASSNYGKSGQFGKNYVSYLMQDETVRDTVLNYWRNTKPDEVAEQVSTRFEQEIKNISGDNKKQALKEMYHSLMKGSKQDKNIDPDENQVKKLLLDTTNRRATQMKAAAEMRFIEIAAKQQANSMNDPDVRLFIQQMDMLIKNTKRSATDRLKTLNDMINSQESLPQQKDKPLSKLIRFIKNLFSNPNLNLQTASSTSKTENSSFKNFKNQLQEAIRTDENENNTQTVDQKPNISSEFKILH